ncbi:hypothetical protein [Fibrella aquatilis]|uniref:Lipocalin-like domain-containing protein n=1 Tax=Fibrella aquatilis TaxID=2817059 RepID=A0A939GC08_9BACT|nr:hypothetical protein [Fibrella aquatilis]MBO0933827.1 hypothetical protein [Fibrella aquatilis]
MQPQLRLIAVGLSLSILFFTGCTNKDVVPDFDTTQVAGRWRLTTARTSTKITANGNLEVTNETRTGKATDIIEFKTNGTMTDPAGLFDDNAGTWNYSVKGSEITLNRVYKGYYTIALNNGTLTFTQNKDQATRTVKDSGFKNIEVIEADVKIDFVKL